MPDQLLLPKLTNMQWIVLSHIESGRWREIAAMGAHYREKAVDLAMMEPPLVEAEGPYVAITAAGKAALVWRRNAT